MRLLPLAATIALALPVAAYAQDADNDDVIVVEGERIDGREVRNTARDITEGARMTQRPLARFQREVCPGVWGMLPQNAQPVIDRILDNAERAGIPVNNEAQCDANVWVIVVDDPAATFEQLDEDDSFMTRHMTPYDERMVREQTGPTRAWNVVSERNREGERVATGFELAGATAEARALGLPPPANPVSTMSRLELGIRLDIELSVLLIARSALADLDTHALADYATMRLLARTTPPGESNSIDTVLDAFDPEGGPQRLTAFDLAYLQALYRSNELRPARFAIGNIGELMENGVPGQE